MHLEEDQEKFWKSYIGSLKSEPIDPIIDIGIAGDESNAHELLALYLSGEKTAGSSLVIDYEIAGDPLPEAGNYWMVLDLDMNPRCILKTIKVETFTFEDVPEHVAVAEGEGDKTVRFWKDAHTNFFSPYLEQWGVLDLSSQVVVTEFYELVYKG